MIIKEKERDREKWKGVGLKKDKELEDGGCRIPSHTEVECLMQIIFLEWKWLYHTHWSLKKSQKNYSSINTKNTLPFTLLFYQYTIILVHEILFYPTRVSPKIYYWMEYKLADVTRNLLQDPFSTHTPVPLGRLSVLWTWYRVPVPDDGGYSQRRGIGTSTDDGKCLILTNYATSLELDSDQFMSSVLFIPNHSITHSASLIVPLYDNTHTFSDTHTRTPSPIRSPRPYRHVRSNGSTSKAHEKYGVKTLQCFVVSVREIH